MAAASKTVPSTADVQPPLAPLPEARAGDRRAAAALLQRASRRPRMNADLGVLKELRVAALQEKRA